MPNVREIEIQRNHRSSFLPTDVGDICIGSALQPLFVDCHRIVSMLPQQLGGIRMEVLINLELHHGVPMGNVTNRSRASSAT